MVNRQCDRSLVETVKTSFLAFCAATSVEMSLLAPSAGIGVPVTVKLAGGSWRDEGIGWYGVQ